MDNLRQDIRYGFRTLARRPGFTAVAVLTLALGIGANVSVFTVVSAVLLHPLPVVDVDRLVSLYTTDSTVDIPGFTLFPSSYRNFEDLRELNEVLSDIGFTAPTRLVLGNDDGEPMAVSGNLVSASYFQTLGVGPMWGRGFTEEEGQLGGGRAVAVLSHSLWSQHFGADTSLVGETIDLNGRPYTVVGVAPPGFRGTRTLVSADQIWVPTSVYDQVLSGVRAERFIDRRGLFLNVFARLADGVSYDEARAHLRALGESLAAQYPRDNRNRGITVGHLADAAFGTTDYRGADESPLTRFAGTLLMSVAGLVLLIACVNLANLLLTRGADRDKEMSLRAELGATPARLAQQLFAENAILAALGGAVGLTLAAWTAELLWRLRPPQISAGLVEPTLDVRVLAFAFGITVVTSLLFGLAPALLGSASTNLHGSLKSGDRHLGSQPGRKRMRHALIATEVALTFGAILTAGLFVRSLQQTSRVDVGFEPDGLATFAVDVGVTGYDEPRGVEFYRLALEAMRQIPGVEAAALSENPPIALAPFRGVVPEGEAEDPTRFGPAVTVNVVSPGYFATTGIRLEEGRSIDSTDRIETRNASVISRTMAELFWPGESALGRRFRFPQTDVLYEVVGVAEDAAVRGLLDEPAPVAYLALEQNFIPSVHVNLRASGSWESVMGAARRRIHELDPKLAITDERAVSDVLAEGLWAPRVGAALLGLFGALALALATVGIYGVLAFLVGQRTREVAIRRAFGASRSQVYRLLILQGMKPVLTGLAIGIATALATTPYLSGLLYGVAPRDVSSYFVTTLIVLAVALAATCLPVRRAVALEPMQALRDG